LSETDAWIRQMAENVWNASQKEARVARTVVLKLKTSAFAILTRSFTAPAPPRTCEQLIKIALSLRDRIEPNESQRFRLVGVGLSNFTEDKQPDARLFD